jgi:hypothetical protein
LCYPVQKESGSSILVGIIELHVDLSANDATTDAMIGFAASCLAGWLLVGEGVNTKPEQLVS